MTKKVNPVIDKVYRDLSVTPTGCLLYENRLVIPAKSRPLVLQAIHSKQQGQTGMLALARLLWYPHIHSEINAQAQNCRHCIDIGKKLKPLIPKNVFPDFVAETCNECDTNTAIENLESFCKLHGIPCSIRCDPAQAFKAKELKIFCTNKKHKTNISTGW